ncbi:MAG: cytidylyltransferase domain-containing protein, partial [bacterium]
MTTIEEAIAIIPARGGSKGIPRKNLEKVGGVELVVRSVRAAQAALRVGEVVVSTDDAQIASCAAATGASIVWRPDELSGDTVASEPVILHTLDALEARGRSAAAVAVFLQCTSPFTEPGDIDGALELLEAERADSVFTGCRFHGFVWAPSPEGFVGVNHDRTHRPRRQDAPVQLLENGALYAFRVPGFLVARHRFFGRVAAFEMPVRRSLEIDEPFDLELAAMISAQYWPQRSLIDALDAVVFDFDGVLTDNRVTVDESGQE